VPCYSSSVYWDTPEGAAAQARAFVDQGFRAFKVKVGLEVENDIASLHAIREEVGDEVDMLVDANQCYTRHLALRVGRELEKLNVALFEEPLSIDDVDGHALLADKLDVRIATGENMYTRWDFLPFLQKKAVHVLQADASRCGGISEAKRIADLAGAHHLHAIPHTFSDALTIAANLHVVAASSNAPIIEYDRTYNEIQEKLVTNPLDVHDSVIELPTQPGLGVEIDWDFVADHPYSGEIGIGAGSRPAFGLVTEVIPDRTSTSLA
jgi:D-galactarolactone cycloisomerase